MPRIVAITGYTGAGKSTAVNFCENLGFGRRVYVGQFVVDAVVAKGWAVNPENEKLIRLALREKHGPAYLAILATPLIEGLLKAGMNVLIDAVLSIEELRFYLERFGIQFQVVRIRASFETRVSRLAERGTRAMNENQIRERDELEVVHLQTNLVQDAASETVDNDYSLDDFHDALRKIVRL
jgi:dephospho-CoA kinase